MIMEYLELVGPLIRYNRLKYDKEPGMICINSGITRQNLKTIETSKTVVHPNTLKRVCDNMDINFVYLFKNLERYEDLFDNGVHIYLHDIKEEQEELLKTLDSPKLDKSVLLPKFLLLRLLFSVQNYKGSKDDEKIDYLIIEVEYFVHVFSYAEKCLFYDCKGLYYSYKSDIEKSEENFKLAEEQPTEESKDILNYHMGVACIRKNSNMEALIYLDKSYHLFEKSWNTNRMIYTMGSSGICYSKIGKLKLAEKSYYKALKMSKKFKNKYSVCISYDNIAYNYLLQRKYLECIENVKLAMKAGSDYEFLYFYMAYSFVKLNKQDEATSWIDKGIELVEKESVEYKYLTYAKKLLKNSRDIDEYLEDLYEFLVEKSQYGLMKFILEDLVEIHHGNEHFISEISCLKRIITLI